MKKNILIALFALTLILGCKSQIAQAEYQTPRVENINIPLREYSILSVLWQQHAAEYRALTYQAFNVAQIQLNNILSNKINYKKPLAIITDIDETVLDNSPYSGKQIELNEEYSISRWLEWGKEKKGKAVPGALNFFNYAHSKGVSVFYVSNRLAEQKIETLQNLQLLGFPFSDETHILLRTNNSGKEPRRSKIKESYEIIMLIGDNLSDFSEVFDDQSTVVRNRKADSLKTAFGNKFIILPNPMYGDWETKGILEKNYNWTSSQKDSIRRSKIIAY